MLVTFRTKYYPNITMFGDVATSLLKAMGQSGKVPGAIQHEDIPAALHRLKESLLAAETHQEAGKAPADEDAKEQPVTLDQRAIPLIELLESAVREKEHVVWDS